MAQFPDFDDILDVAGGFDIITPLWAFIQDALNGPPADFALYANAGWTIQDVRQLFEYHSINVWGLMYHDDMLMFTVRKQQADWTRYVLQRARAPIMYSPW